MLTSLMIAVSIWGTDPGIVFSGESAPWTNHVYQIDEPFSDELIGIPPRQESPRPWKSSQNANRSNEGIRSTIARLTQVGRLPAESIDAEFEPAISDQSILWPDIVRGQTVSDTTPSPYSPGCHNELGSSGSLCDHPIVREFISGMNPFIDEDVKTLPNYYDPFGLQMGTGSKGPPGYRMGWVSYNDITILPSAAARGATGNFSALDWNSNIKYSHMLRPGVLFIGTGYFNARWWDGPGSVPVPGQVDQISTDLELGLYNDGPWSGQIAFHPQIVETYDAPLDRNAFNFDGRAIATYKASPQWSFVGGVAIWDRVNTLIVPHAGVIWTPNERWEFRILFPRTRISYFLGTRNYADYWLYGQAEYTAESFQSYDKDTLTSDRIQFTDDRLSLGLRRDSGRYSIFVEGGFVFNRQVKFAGSTPGFDLNDTGMIRAGFRY